MTRYLGAAELRRLFNVSRQRADALTRRVDFPEPAFELEQGRVWRFDDVAEWARKKNRAIYDWESTPDDTEADD